MKKKDTLTDIAIVLPVYNGEQYITQCIESILKQTYTHFKLIIVNDASTDSTAHILQKYATQDVRIQLLTHKRNKGIAHALNTGLTHTTQFTFIARIDSDEFMNSKRLELQRDFLLHNPKIGIVGSYVKHTTKGVRNYPTTDLKLKKFMFYLAPFAHGSVLMRRSLLSEYGAYNTKLTSCEDLELWLRFGVHTQFANIPRPLTIQQHTRNSMTDTKTHDMLKLATQLRESYVQQYAKYISLRTKTYLLFVKILLFLPAKLVQKIYDVLRFRK